MNGAEIIEKLKEILRPEGEYDDWTPYKDVGHNDMSDEITEELDAAFGNYEYVLTADRPFGEEDTQRTVIYFSHHDVYLALDGYYDSWSGGNWDDADFYEVKPVEKTYTDWDAI